MTKRTFIMALLFLSCWAYSGTCAAEKMYLITESELTRLEQILGQRIVLSQEQEKKLQEAKDLQLNSEKKISLLVERLTKSEDLLLQAQNSIEKSRQSFNAYDKEVQSQIRKLKLQNILIGVAAAYIGHSIK